MERVHFPEFCQHIPCSLRIMAGPLKFANDFQLTGNVAFALSDVPFGLRYALSKPPPVHTVQVSKSRSVGKGSRTSCTRNSTFATSFSAMPP